MNIGLSSASFYPNVITEDSIKVMKKIGFDLGEVFLNTPSEYDFEFGKKLVEEKEKYDFYINSVHCFSSQFEPYLFDKYKRRREDMLKYFRKVCKIGKMLGANCYTFHGMRFENLKTLDLNFIIDIYNELLYICLEEGIQLAQENVSWCMSSNLNFLELLIEKLRYTLKFTLDVKQAYKASVEPIEYIDIMGKNIINFHINDRDENNVCLLPGKGNVDLQKIVLKLKEMGYNGNGIIEVYSNNYKNYSELLEAKKYLCYLL